MCVREREREFVRDLVRRRRPRACRRALPTRETVEEGSFFRLVDVCIIQLQAESNKDEEKKLARISFVSRFSACSLGMGALGVECRVRDWGLGAHGLRCGV